MKKLINRYLFILLCVFNMSLLGAKQVDLVDLLFDDKNEEISVKSQIKNNNIFIQKKDALEIAEEENSIVLGKCSLSENIELEPNTDDESQESPTNETSPCDLLDLLFADSPVVSTLFPDKQQKYYRGQFAMMGLHYIDNSICYDSMPSQIRSKRPIDQTQLSPEEKEVIDRYYALTKQQYESPWYMKFINKKIGYGIYAAADIEPGQLIAEYVGIIYDEAYYMTTPQNPKFCWNVQPPSFVKNGQKFYVDAIESCNFTRIINHSYKPNVIPLQMHGPDGSRMLYVACEKIKKDEQLLVNYGNGYWQQRGEPEELRP